jgi:hypothetical protein
MDDELGPLEVEQQFFKSLILGDAGALDGILSDDFLLIDVMMGAEITKFDLLAALASRQLKFHKIEPMETRVRPYGTTAVITGRTEMSGRFGEAAFSASSRYTHIFAKAQSRWRLVSAQGTQIKN